MHIRVSAYTDIRASRLLSCTLYDAFFIIWRNCVRGHNNHLRGARYPGGSPLTTGMCKLQFRLTRHCNKTPSVKPRLHATWHLTTSRINSFSRCQFPDCLGIRRRTIGCLFAVDLLAFSRSIEYIPVYTKCLRLETVWARGVHGNGIPRGNGIPMGFPWEWE